LARSPAVLPRDTSAHTVPTSSGSVYSGSMMNTLPTP
jgi:hypothetical protein